jgi:SAM-dependent methyltransferase
MRGGASRRLRGWAGASTSVRATRTGSAFDGGFDVVVMHTLVSHVADSAAVLAEGRRLLRPGGRSVVFDGDYASLTFATDAPDGGEATDALIRGNLVANQRVMRAMPRLLAEAGLDLLLSRAYVAADIGRVDF